jgi:hypothetical protein
MFGITPLFFNTILGEALIVAAIAAVLFVIFKLGGLIMKLLIGIITNSVLGIISIFVLNLVFNIGIPITLYTLIPVALFGLPAVGTLLILKAFGALL